MSSALFLSSCSSPSQSNVVDSHTSDADAQNANPMQSPSILHLSFNQDAGCFAVGTTDGFVLFNTDPFGESLRRNSGLSGVGNVQMLFRSNILALVGTDGSSRNKVLIWDDRLNHCIRELLFRSEVKAVRLRSDRIVVVMLQKIYVYDFFNYKLIHQIETQENPLGVCEISQTAAPMVLVCLGLQRGFVRVEQYATKHNSSVAFVALMYDGRLMATASSKGTLVRVFSTTEGSLLQEVLNFMLYMLNSFCICSVIYILD